MCCSQSERGGLRCANAEVEKPGREIGGKSNLKYATHTLIEDEQTREERGKLHLKLSFFPQKKAHFRAKT